MKSATEHSTPILVAIDWAGDWANDRLVLVLVYVFTGYFFDSVRKATAETDEPVLMRNDWNDASPRRRNR